MKKFTLLLLAASTLTKYGMLPIYSQDVAEGTYLIDIISSTDNFQPAEASLTVQDGEMSADVTVIGTPYEALWTGTADEASTSSEDEQIPFQLNADIGYTYTIPVSALDREIVISGLDGASGKWEEFTILADASSLPEDALLLELPDYDLIENALSTSEESGENTPNPAMEPAEQIDFDMEDGEYSIGTDISGGSGKAFVSTPALLTVKDGKATVRLEWSSSNYDYMIVGGEKYLPLNTEGNSVFEIPVTALDEEIPIIADTLAMGAPHEVSYSLTFYSASIGSKGQMPQEAAKRVLAIAFIIIVGGGILNHFVKRRRLK